MIEVLTEHRVAVCANCSTVIREYDGDLSRGRKRWSHDKTGTSTCPGAPEAEPIPRTIQTAQKGLIERD